MWRSSTAYSYIKETWLASATQPRSILPGRQGIDEARIILGLGGMEPGIFQQKDVAVPHRLDRALRGFSAVGSKADVASKLAFKLHRDRLQ
jgi:hypothetical protein